MRSSPDHCLLGAVPGPPACRQPQCPQTAEFSLDGVASLQHKGFTIEPSKGFVERGQTKTISISWVPPIDFDVGAWAGGQGAVRSQRPGGMGAPPPPQGGVAGRAWGG